MQGVEVHAVTVVTLLEKLATMLETLRERQGGLAQRQGGLAGSVRRIQSNLGALSRSHDTTSNTLAQLLAKAERVGSHADAAQERAVRRAAQVQRLEANHGLLVARVKLHVLLFKVSDLRRPRIRGLFPPAGHPLGLPLPSACRTHIPDPTLFPSRGTHFQGPRPLATAQPQPSLTPLKAAWPMNGCPALAQATSTEAPPSTSPSPNESNGDGSAS